MISKGNFTDNKWSGFIVMMWILPVLHTCQVESAPEELAPHAAHKNDDVVVETVSSLKESEATKEAVDPEATQTSKKRGWKPSFLNKLDEGYDDAWISGERRSKAHILSKGCGKDAKKRRSSSPKCAISNGESGAEVNQTVIINWLNSYRKLCILV